MRLLLILSIVFLLKLPVHTQIIIKNVTVVDVLNKKLLQGHDVLVQDGIITAVSTNIKTPKGTTIIDGTGKYVMPGLVDTHAHFFQSGSIYTRPDIIDLRKHKPYAEEIKWTHEQMENILRRYTYAGITSVVDVGTTLNFLKRRDSFRTKSFAPEIYMAGPLLTTFKSPVYAGLNDDDPFNEIKTIEEARDFIRQQLPFRPDFIKVGYLLLGSDKDSAAKANYPLVAAAIDEAHKNNLRVSVHATQLVASQLAVEAGANHLVHGVDDKLIDESYIQLLKNRNVVVTPSLLVHSKYNIVFRHLYHATEDDIHYAHPAPLKTLMELKDLSDTTMVKNYFNLSERNSARVKTADSIRIVNLKRMLDGGVTIALGTDAGNIGSQHVSSYFHELAAIKNSGFDMWQLLQTATINGARAVGKDSEFGSVTKGKKANLILLQKNPLENISNWKSIEWVINKGVAQTPASIRNF
jgi:imidazolonepropionase-like amidohydrolase